MLGLLCVLTGQIISGIMVPDLPKTYWHLIKRFVANGISIGSWLTRLASLRLYPYGRCHVHIQIQIRVTGHLCGVNPLHKGQWRGAFMFSFICAWLNLWVNNREAGDLRRYCAHYDVIVMNWIDSIKVKRCHTRCLPYDTFKRFITWWRHQT